jgi:hypothetical protein
MGAIHAHLVVPVGQYSWVRELRGGHSNEEEKGVKTLRLRVFIA